MKKTTIALLMALAPTGCGTAKTIVPDSVEFEAAEAFAAPTNSTQYPDRTTNVLMTAL